MLPATPSLVVILTALHCTARASAAVLAPLELLFPLPGASSPRARPRCPSAEAPFPSTFSSSPTQPALLSLMLTELTVNQRLLIAYDCTVGAHMAALRIPNVNACNTTRVAAVGVKGGTPPLGEGVVTLVVLDTTDATRGLDVFDLLAQALSLSWFVLLLGAHAKEWVNTLQTLCAVQPTWNAAFHDGAGFLYPLVRNITLPPYLLPPALHSEYTLHGAIPTTEWYWQNALFESGEGVHTYSVARVEAFQAIVKARQPYKAEYPGLDVALYALLQAHPVAGHHVLIMGSTEPWYEAVALEHGAARVTVVEYGRRECVHPLIRCIHPAELLSAGVRYTAVWSLSSFEHDGLGRYGDPLNPDGDLTAMASVRDVVLAHGGVLYLNVPIGPDYLWWNAGRVYGPIRWPLLVAGWDVEAHAGYNASFLSLPRGSWAEAAWLLKPTEGAGPPALAGAEAA